MSLVKKILIVGMLLSVASARPDDNARIIGGKEVSTLSLLCADDDRQHALYVIMS